MQAIDYAVKSGGGAVSRGAMAAEEGASLVQMGVGQEISLNLRRESVTNFVREGANLQIYLADGRTIVLQDFFASDANKLYLSADGELSQVLFTEEMGTATFSHYADAGNWGKWNPADDLIFVDGDEVLAAETYDDDAVAMLAPAALVGAGPIGALIGAGLLGAAALSGDDDDGGGSSTVTDPTDPTDPTVPTDPGTTTPITVNPGTHVVTSDTTTQTVAITGTAPAGSTVVVTVDDITLTTTADADGNWSVSTGDADWDDDGTEDGTYTATVVVTPEGEDPTTLTGPTFIVDTVVDVVVTDGAGSTNDVWNETEYDTEDGVRITGTSEPGATVTLTVDVNGTPVTGSALVDANGDWTIEFTESQVPSGEHTFDMTVSAVDQYGNSITKNDTVVIDTEVAVTVDTANFEGDNTANYEEAIGTDAPATLYGTTDDPSNTIVLTIGARTYTVPAANIDADGNWFFDYPSSVPVADRYTVTVSAVATDAAGNSTATDGVQAAQGETGTIDIDTRVVNMSINELGDTFNAGTNNGGVVLTGTSEIGSTSVIVRIYYPDDYSVVALRGTVFAETTAVVNPTTGTWTATFTPAQIGQIELDDAKVVMFDTDAAGNIDDTDDQYGSTDTIDIDTIIPDAMDAGDVTYNTLNETSGLTMDNVIDSDHVLSVASVAQDGASVADLTVGANLSFDVYSDPDLVTNSTDYTFVNPLGDGEDVVMSVADLAGNSSATYIALDDTATSQVSIGSAVTDNFNIDQIELSFATDAVLNLTEAQVIALSENGDSVTIEGGVDDTVNLTGVTAQTVENVDGTNYDVYTLGDATVYVDQEVDVNIV